MLLSNSCLALSALTHPYAILGLCGCLAIAGGYGDWRRVGVRSVIVALAPYAVAFGGWALLIGNHGQVFVAQMANQSETKLVDWSHPIQVLQADFSIRWWQLFAGWRDSVPVFMRAKTVFLLVWVAALPLASIDRGEETRGVRLGLVVYSIAVVLLLPFSDALHVQIYNIHAIVGLTAVSAIVLTDFVRVRHKWRLPALLTLCALCAFGVLGIGGRIVQQELQREYTPVAQWLARTINPNEVVIAPAEFGFALKFQQHVRGDSGLKSLGAGGAMPRFIVESMERGVGRIPMSVPCAPGGAAVRDVTTYTVVPLETPRSYYRIYRQADVPVPTEALPSERTVRIVRDCWGRR
jgi:hypothetical protein